MCFIRKGSQSSIKGSVLALIIKKSESKQSNELKNDLKYASSYLKCCAVESVEKLREERGNERREEK